MAKINRKVWETQTALKEFTDREHPQEAFERKVRVLCQTWKDDEYFVLNYYGIGGIGKTSFKNKLCRVMRGEVGNEPRILDKIDCNYVQYDFEAKSSGTDKLSILLSLRKQLGDVDKNFKFFCFDSAVLLYAKKTGLNIEKDDTTKSLLEGIPWLDSFVSTVGLLPGVNGVTNLVQVVDKVVKVARTSIGRHIEENQFRTHLNTIDSLEASELLGNLHDYFIKDMQQNMWNVATKPLVVFLDAYEKYIDTLNCEIGMITEDYWLRKGDKSVIRSIPGILWVIIGREKLYWSDDDIWETSLAEELPLSKMSEEEKEILAKTALEQHLMGDLSEVDAGSFLRKAGICDEILIKQLYELTKGTPLFLDVCVDTYHVLRDRGVRPEIMMFGDDLTQLTSRYLLNMSGTNQKMAYFLACLGTWDDERVQRISEQAKTLTGWYSRTKYESFIDHSFIIKNVDGSYSMHESVRNAALKNADKEIVEEIRKINLSIVKRVAETDETLGSGVSIAEYVKVLTENHLSYEEFYKQFNTVLEKLCVLREKYLYDLLVKATKEILQMVQKQYPDTGIEQVAKCKYGEALCLHGFIQKALEVVSDVKFDYKDGVVDENDWNIAKENVASIYSENGMYKESLNLRMQIVEGMRRDFGEEHLNTLSAMNNLALSWGEMGDYGKEVELVEAVLEIKTRNMGENDPDTVVLMHNLAACYIRAGKNQKAFTLLEKVIKINEEVLGGEHPETLTAMSNLACYYSGTGDYWKAIEIDEKVLVVRKRVLGEAHPDTLITMANLGCDYFYAGEWEKAFELRERTVELKKTILGEEHPSTLGSISDLARSYAKKGEIQDAVKLDEWVLGIMKRVLGEEHPDTLGTMGNLASDYNAMGRYQDAKALCEKVLVVSKRVLGEGHPDVLVSMNNLASYYYSNEEYQMALELYEKVLIISSRVLGEEHPHTIEFMNNLATRYYSSGEYRKALELSEKATKIGRSVFGKKSWTLLASLTIYGLSCKTLGEEEKLLEIETILAELSMES